jgi:hypothetical protein
MAQNLPFPGHLNCLGWHPARKEHREHAAILILAQNLEHHVLPLVEVRQGPMQSVERIYGVVVDLNNHISLREPDILGETAGVYFGDNHASLALHTQVPRAFRA